MIPFIIGAAMAAAMPGAAVAGALGIGAGLAGVALLGGDDKSNEPKTEKQQVSEDYVARQLARAGKKLRGGD